MSELREQVKDAIRYIGVNKKTSGGWVDEVVDPVVDELMQLIQEERRQAKEEVFNQLTNIMSETSYYHLNCNIEDGKCLDHQYKFSREELGTVWMLDEFRHTILDELKQSLADKVNTDE